MTDANEISRTDFGSSCLQVLNSSRPRESFLLSRYTVILSCLCSGRSSSFDTTHPLFSCSVLCKCGGRERGQLAP
jgi:hypothetical protein